MKKLNVLSLFDGISCGQVALQRAGIKVNKYYASEIEQHPVAITQYNFPDTIQLGDINNWREWNIDWNTVDVVIGGSPCQGLTFAGKKLQLEDPRSKLFFVYIDILNYLRNINPNIKFFLENVKMNSGSEEKFNELTGCNPYKVNSNLVSAQNRQRNYWTNIEGFNIPKDRNKLVKDVIRQEDNAKYHLSVKHLRAFHKSYNWKSTSINGKSPTLMASYYKQPPHSPYIPCEESESGYRMFSPVECERLQTLPDDYTKYGDYDGTVKEVAKTNRYKAIGNGWTVDIITEFFKGLKENN